MKRGLKIFLIVLVFVLAILVILIVINLQLSKSSKGENKNVKTYADVIPFKLKDLSKREQLLFDLYCKEEWFYKIYPNKLNPENFEVWAEEYVNGKLSGGMKMVDLAKDTHEIEVGFLYLKDGKYLMYTITDYGSSRIDPIEMKFNAKNDNIDRMVINATESKIKNDQPFVLLLMVEGAKNKNNGLEIIESDYIKYDSKYFEQLAKKYTHVFVVAAKFTGKIK